MSQFHTDALTKRLSLGALTIAATLVTHTALAQTSGTAASDDSATETRTLEEIVVTAEKRTTSAQSTAIALNVFTSEALRESGVGDIGALGNVAPTVNFGQNAGATTVALRGVSSRDITEIGDPAVAINIDGVFLQRPTGMNASFYDLERIEVLRGPQGTLYGRNATGGVINIITAKPTQTSGGYAAITAGNYDTVNAEAAINLPLTDTLAMRTSFVSRSHEGYRSNGSAGRGDDEDAQGGRVQFLYEPTDRLSFLLSGSYLKQQAVGPVYYGIPFNSSQPVPPTDIDDVKSFDLSTRGDFNVTRKNVVLQADFDLDFATLTYLGGYVGLDFKHLWDNDGQPNLFFDYDRDEVSRDISHELRLASNNQRGFVWQAGFYYYDQFIDLNNNFLLSPNRVPVSVREYHFDVDSESYAAFGQASLDFTDRLKASAGVRYSKDEKSRDGFSYVGSLTQDVSSGTAVRTFSTEDTSASWNKVTWHVGLDYQLTPDSLLYAKVDTGYKSGGFTLVAPYDPEELTAYEIGSKNRFLADALQVNLSAFFYDYENQQVTQFVSSGPLTGQSTVLNAGASEIYGIEAETTWLIAPETMLDFSAAYLNAEFTDFAVAAGTGNLSLNGNKVVQSPEWSLSVGLQHVFNVGAGTLTPRINSQYRSSSYLTFYNRPNDRQEPYTLTDLSLTYKPESEAWNVQAFVRNAENTLVLTNADQGGPYNATRYQFGAPRTFGLRLQVNW